MQIQHASTKALITGGTQGLGLAIARQLLEDGCRNIVIASRDAKNGPALAENLSKDGASVHFVRADMGDVDQVLAMVDTARDLMEGVNALVNCAATCDRGSILDTSLETWDRVMDVNARGAFFAIQRFAQLAIKAGHGGGVVNILSIVVHGGLPFLAPYSASKAALLNITKNSANTLAAHKIRVNGINVGWMDTPGEDATQRKWHGAGDDWLEVAEARMPFGQLVKPEHVAGQAGFFLSPQSGVVTGTTIDFDQQVVGVYPDTHD